MDTPLEPPTCSVIARRRPEGVASVQMHWGSQEALGLSVKDASVADPWEGKPGVTSVTTTFTLVTHRCTCIRVGNSSPLGSGVSPRTFGETRQKNGIKYKPPLLHLVLGPHGRPFCPIPHSIQSK